MFIGILTDIIWLRLIGEFMKIRSIWVVLFIIIGFSPNIAVANVKPVVESFSFSPNEIDLEINTTKIDFELVVSHPNGIENTSTLATITNRQGDSLATYLTRVDFPINSDQQRVIFKGSLVIPKEVEEGIYDITVSPISNSTKAGYKFNTGLITPNKIRNIVGAEYGILVRSKGNLNLIYDTFVGPSYDNTLGIAFNDPLKFNSLTLPIFRVGEIFNPNTYFELRVPELQLSVDSSTPSVCKTLNNNLQFLKEGACTFLISTPKNSNYSERKIVQNVTILGARVKPSLFVGSIQNQTSKDLPKNIPLTWVYGESGVYVIPKSETPSVCLATGFFVRILSGGNCTITYQSEETNSYLESNLYKVSFEVTRDPQTISFTLPSTANVSSKSLALTATASSGSAVSYSTTSTGICSITGSTLNLLTGGNCTVTATQAGTSTLAPASATATVMLTGAVVANKKSISCVKGKSTKKVSGTNPKCPKGYKLKK